MTTIGTTAALVESVDAIKKRLVTAQDINQLRACFYALEDVAQKSILIKSKQTEAAKKELQESRALLADQQRVADQHKATIDQLRIMIFQDLPPKARRVDVSIVDSFATYQGLHHAEHDAKKKILHLLLEQIDILERERTVIVGKVEKSNLHATEMKALMVSSVPEDKKPTIQHLDNPALLRKVVEHFHAEIKRRDDTIQALVDQKAEAEKKSRETEFQLQFAQSQYTDSLMVANQILGSNNEDLLESVKYIGSNVIPQYEHQVGQLSSQLQSLQTQHKELEERFFKIGESLQSFEQDRQRKSASIDSLSDRLRYLKSNVQQSLFNILSRIPGDHDHQRIEELINKAPKDADDYALNLLTDAVQQKLSSAIRRLQSELESMQQAKLLDQEKLNRVYESMIKIGQQPDSMPATTRSFNLASAREAPVAATPDVLSARLRDLEMSVARRDDIIMQLDQRLVQMEQEMIALQQDNARFLSIEEEYQAFQTHAKEIEGALRIRDDQIDLLTRKLHQAEENLVEALRFVEHLCQSINEAKEQFERNDRQIEVLIERIKDLEAQKHTKNELLRQLQQEQEEMFRSKGQHLSAEYKPPITDNPEDIELSELFNSARQTLKAIGDKTAGQDATLLNREMLERLYDEEIQVTAGEILMREEQLGLLADKIGVAEAVFSDVAEQLGRFCHEMRLPNVPSTRAVVDPLAWNFSYADTSNPHLQSNPHMQSQSRSYSNPHANGSIHPSTRNVNPAGFGPFTAHLLGLSQPQHQHQPQHQTQPQFQSQSQPQSQTQPQFQSQSQPQSQTQPQFQSQSQPQSQTYTVAHSVAQIPAHSETSVNPASQHREYPIQTTATTATSSATSSTTPKAALSYASKRHYAALPVEGKDATAPQQPRPVLEKKLSQASMSYRSLPNIHHAALANASDAVNKSASGHVESFRAHAGKQEINQSDGRLLHSHDDLARSLDLSQDEDEDYYIILEGDAVEGSHLIVTGPLVDRFASSCTFTWARRIPNKGEFARILGETKSEILLQLSDVGYEFQCHCECRDESGESLTGSAVSVPVKMAHPRIQEMDVTGGPTHTAPLTVRAKYVGGKEGQSIIQWHRSLNEGPFSAIPGANKAMYQPSADDINATLRVDYLPIRSDGVKGQLFSKLVPTSYMAIDSSIREAVEKNVRLAEVVFEVAVKCPGGLSEPRMLVINQNCIKLKKAQKTKNKFEYSPFMKVALDTENTALLHLDLDPHTSLDIFAQDHRMRDVIAITLRSFIGIHLATKARMSAHSSLKATA
eukprot:TRINITY_DN1818_c0_g1_i9.p1 TRINITY_DN1818_c0_g1~~TRINITY_DN1818_c0_g1_i9.p1  ORF type:complete len:1274 (+),score=344.38 TRINITY_DN1818_c0_g1_i9:129-3950(+)